MEMMNQKLLLQAGKLFEAVTQQNELKKTDSKKRIRYINYTFVPLILIKRFSFKLNALSL